MHGTYLAEADKGLLFFIHKGSQKNLQNKLLFKKINLWENWVLCGRAAMSVPLSQYFSDFQTSLESL